MLASRHGTSDPEAYVLYASGRFAFLRLTEATLLQAIDFYRQAVTRDPSYARAYAGLADCYSLLGVIGARAPHETFPLARAAVDKALELDPQLASAYTARAQIHAVYDFDAHGALEDLNRAAEIDPELASIYFYRGVVYGVAGRQRAQPPGISTRSATGARPGSPRRLPQALALFYSRRYDEAIMELRRILALNNNFDLARGFLIRTLLAKGAYDEALQELQGRESADFRQSRLPRPGARPRRPARRSEGRARPRARAGRSNGTSRPTTSG